MRKAATVSRKQPRPAPGGTGKTAAAAAVAAANGSSHGSANGSANGAHGAANGSAAHAAAAQGGDSLETYVFKSLEQYFANLDGAKPHALHEMVLGAIERPLLQFALRRCDGNQSAAADLLGMNRNTLRRKLQDYGLH